MSGINPFKGGDAKQFSFGKAGESVKSADLSGDSDMSKRIALSVAPLSMLGAMGVQPGSNSFTA